MSLLLFCQQINLSQSCLHFCHISRPTSRSPVSTFVMSADPPLAVLSPLLLCQQTSPFVMSADPPLAVPVSTFVVSEDPHLAVRSTFVVSADPHLAVLSPLLSCQQISPFVMSADRGSCLHFCHPVSTFVVSADPPLTVLSPLLWCQQIHLLQSCLHFCHVSRSTYRSCVSTFVVPADQSFCHVSRSTSCNPVSIFVMSTGPPLVIVSKLLSNQFLVVLSPLLSCQHIHPSQFCLHFCRVSRSTPRSSVSTFVVSANPLVAVLYPLLSPCIHFCHPVSTYVVLSQLLSPLLSSCLHFCRPVSTFVNSADPPSCSPSPFL